jgi:hypothetical protein
LDRDEFVVVEFVEMAADLSIADWIVNAVLVGGVQLTGWHRFAVLGDVVLDDFVEGALGGFE